MSGELACCQRGYAKINLSLDILGQREDGFHEVAMVMQTLRLWDEVTAELLPEFLIKEQEKSPARETEWFREGEPVIRVTCNLSYVPRDERNLAYKAARLFLRETGIRKDVTLHIFKKIPVAAGLAGGSADAAACLKAMNRLFGLHLPIKKLMEMGAKIGSDVPYCLIGGTCLATGRGEIVERIAPLPEAQVVMVKPDFGISTPWAYQSYDESEVRVHPDHAAMIDAIRRRDWEGIGKQMINLLEGPVTAVHPILKHIKRDLAEKGALAVLMSGSGPTVYGIFNKDGSAARAFMFMKKFYGSRCVVLERDFYQPVRHPAFTPEHRQSEEEKE